MPAIPEHTAHPVCAEWSNNVQPNDISSPNFLQEVVCVFPSAQPQQYYLLAAAHTSNDINNLIWYLILACSVDMQQEKIRTAANATFSLLASFVIICTHITYIQ